jgi:hypothetical protein
MFRLDGSGNHVHGRAELAGQGLAATVPLD